MFTLTAEDMLPLCLFLWIPLVAFLVAQQWSRANKGSGLTLAYITNLGVIHWLGAAAHVFPDAPRASHRVTAEGFALTTLGVCIFVLGAWIAGLIVRSHPTGSRRNPLLAPIDVCIKACLAAAAVSLVISRAVGKVPTITALLSAGTYFLVPACCLGCWQAYFSSRWRDFALWLLFLLTVPAVTTLVAGFLGYGVAIVVAVIAFLITFVRPRRYLAVLGVAGLYFGLSLFVTYMRDRVAIRSDVGERSSVSARLSRAAASFENFEWIDPKNAKHLSRIDERLNQNHLVGSAIEHLDVTGDFADGGTIADSVLALVPRALWPDKPIVAGSGNLVSNYTGLRFAQGTSVGVGHVLEFYLNFGAPGVIIGFGLLGAILAILDQTSRRALERRDYLGFTIWFTPGLGLLHAEGSLVELTATTASIIIVAKVMSDIISRKKRKRDMAVEASVWPRNAAPSGSKPAVLP